MNPDESCITRFQLDLLLYGLRVGMTRPMVSQLVGIDYESFNRLLGDNSSDFATRVIEAERECEKMLRARVLYGGGGKWLRERDERGAG